MRDPDQAFMRLALRLAKRGLGQTWPNPSVGAVLVQSYDRIVGVGSTAKGGRPHAEVIALQMAGVEARGATMYVTLEPCAHQGRGAPCTKGIAEAKVARVVCAIADPDPRANGAGIEQLKKNGIAVQTGLLEADARQLALGHILRVTQTRPFVQLKLAVGSDGRMAAGQGAPVWVTGEQARAAAHLLRAQTDAIMVGSGTIRADNPMLTCRLPGLQERSPVRVVMDSELQVPPTARVFAESARVPVWLICGEGADGSRKATLKNAGVEVIAVQRDRQGKPELASVLTGLAQKGITRLLVEGGPTLAHSCIEAGAVDEAIIFRGGKAAGPDGIEPIKGGTLEQALALFEPVEMRRLGNDAMTVYRPKS